MSNAKDELARLYERYRQLGVEIDQIKVDELRPRVRKQAKIEQELDRLSLENTQEFLGLDL